MATTIDPHLLPVTDGPARRWIRDSDVERAMLPLTILFCVYATRDAFTGSLRYSLAQLHLAGLWFIPDLLSFVAMGYFTWMFAIRRQSAWAVLLTIMIFASTILGWLFMSSSSSALLSALKLFTPMYVGFAFAGRSISDLRWAKNYLFALVAASTLGLLLSPVFDYPWVGMTVETFGQTKEVGRVWWTGGAVRYGGFAGDSTMAAYMCLFPLVAIHRRVPKWLMLVIAVPVGWAIVLSTSKTALGCGIVFTLYYLAVEIFNRHPFSPLVVRRLAQWSFALVPIPFVLMVLLGGVNLESINPTLFSLQDRINNTWLFPFTYMAINFPIGLVTGCGLGCFTYPMEYTYLAHLWVPVDSFYVATYVMLGAPFLLFVTGMFTATIKSNDAEKLALILIFNVYSVTVQCYGPSTATMLIGYAFSDMFLSQTRVWRQRRHRASTAN